MAKIKYKNFELIHKESDRFDLKKTHMVEREDKETGEKGMHEVTNILGYDMRFESCLKRIVITETLENVEVIGIEDFLKKYKEVLNKVTNILEPIKA